MSTEFLNGRRFVFARTIEIPQDENTNDVMEGSATVGEDQTVSVTLTRDDIENGRAIFLMTREGFDASDYLNDTNDPDAMEHEVFGEPEPDIDVWLVPVEGSDPAGYRYNLDRVNNVLTFETSEGLKTLEGDAFREGMYSAVRVDENGRMICGFNLPLETQEKLCQDAGATEHLAEIGREFEAMKQHPDGYIQARAFTHDINKISSDEAYSDDAISQKQEENRETLIERSQLAERTDANWDILLNNDLFRNPQVRGIFNHFMASRLKDFPIDQVGITRFDTLEDSVSALSDAFPEQKEVAPFDGGAIMPGYRTSPVHEFTDGKMTVITFSDLPGMPVHAYAYPNELTLDADVTPDAPAPAF